MAARWPSVTRSSPPAAGCWRPPSTSSSGPTRAPPSSRCAPAAAWPPPPSSNESEEVAQRPQRIVEVRARGYAAEVAAHVLAQLVETQPDHVDRTRGGVRAVGPRQHVWYRFDGGDHARCRVDGGGDAVLV